MEMQEKLGTPIIVINSKNEILIGKRINSYKSDYYGMPGGRVELKELMIDTVRRELAEETGLESKSIEFIGVIRELQVNYNFIHFGFLVKEFFGEVKNLEPEKCEGWEWHPVNKLPDKMLPAHKAIIEMYLNPNSPHYRDLI